MSVDASVIAYVLKYNGLLSVQMEAIDQDYFVDEYRTAWKYILKIKRTHGEIPSLDTVQARFPDIEFPNIKKRELSLLIDQLKQRKKFRDFIEALNDAAQTTNSFEEVDDVIQSLQGRLNDIYAMHQGKSHLIDLFSPDAAASVLAEIERRRSGRVYGMPTGLQRFDSQCGGLQKQQMVVVAGRTGMGKSWLNLLFVANAVMNGEKVILYPLEMTLFETAARLYTIFSHSMLGGDKVFRNTDIVSGRVSVRKVTRFFGQLEDKFKGQLHVADVSSLSDRYTNERIEAEVELYKPDMFWVDYLTLMKAPRNNRGDDDGHEAVRRLADGIKNTAMRQDVVGGASAQVNREALRTNLFLPRLEHIAYGDAIGHNADKVFMLNQRKGDLHYALVKNRGGLQIGTNMKFGIRVRTDFDTGLMVEHTSQYEESEDD